MTYVATLSGHEYHFQSLQEAAEFLYNKVKLLYSKGETDLDFNVYFLTDQKTYRDLNSFELNSFNRFCADLWRQHSSQEDNELLTKHQENLAVRAEKLKLMEEERKRNEN